MNGCCALCQAWLQLVRVCLHVMVVAVFMLCLKHCCLLWFLLISFN